MRHLKMHNHYLPAHIDCILVVKEPLASGDFFATNLICSSTVVWQPEQFQWKLLFRYLGTKCGRKRSLGINHESQFLPSLQPPPHPINWSPFHGEFGEIYKLRRNLLPKMTFCFLQLCIRLHCNLPKTKKKEGHPMASSGGFIEGWLQIKVWQALFVWFGLWQTVCYLIWHGLVWLVWFTIEVSIPPAVQWVLLLNSAYSSLQ